jgi:hypothetical protein
MMCCKSKIFFAKNQELVLLALKSKHTQVLVKSVAACVKSKKQLQGLRDKTRADMHIPGGLLFMWNVVPNFPFAILIAASQKSDFGSLKMENALFLGRNKNRPPWSSSPSQ